MPWGRRLAEAGEAAVGVRGRGAALRYLPDAMGQRLAGCSKAFFGFFEILVLKATCRNDSKTKARHLKKSSAPWAAAHRAAALLFGLR